MIYHERKILTTLRRHFDGHKYQLMNTYIFNWESDYFGVTSSGYIYEIEVKISRADFKADAKKVRKHRAIKNTIQKIKMMTVPGYLHYKVETPEMILVRDENGRIKYNEKGDFSEIPSGKYFTRIVYNMDKIRSNHKDLKTEIISSEVHFRKTPKVPNRFYYCAPKGIIKVHEVPHYAGLITIENNCIEIVKPAPFIHKNKLDLTKILLEKFYFRSLKLERNQTELF